MLAATCAHAETLEDVLAGQGLSGWQETVPAARPITSYAVYRDEESFLLAYYYAQPHDKNFLEDTLRVLRIDLPSRRVDAREILLPLELETYQLTHLGSVLEVRKINGRYYLKGHLTPSASPTLVLNEDLTVHDVLPGWIVNVEKGGGIICQRNAVHFAPAREPEFFLYEAGNRQRRDLPGYHIGPA